MEGMSTFCGKSLGGFEQDNDMISFAFYKGHFLTMRTDSRDKKRRVRTLLLSLRQETVVGPVGRIGVKELKCSLFRHTKHWTKQIK
jgi:hypothetical protein